MAKNCQMATDSPCDASKAEGQNHFTERIASKRPLYAEADLIIAMNGSQQDILLGDYEVPKDKCRLVPHGYDERRFFSVDDSIRQPSADA